MRRGNKTTLQDVADAAGVSCMVASVVLNNARSTTRVSASTREKILEAGLRLNYRRNAAAVGLSKRKMDTIGVVATIDGYEVNLYVLELLNGILESAAAVGQNCTVFAIKSWQLEEHRLLDFCDGRIDGLILIAPVLTKSVADNLPHHSPLVTINSDTNIPYAHNLDVNNREAAYRAVDHLVKLGHRQILHISGGTIITNSVHRTEGYIDALHDNGLEVDPALIVHGGFSEWTGRHSMNTWFDEGRSAPSAIFCGSDAIAAGCMEVLATRGFNVPSDVSVVGFDDTILARTTSPPLTTVKQPFREMGRQAVQLVMEQIASDGEQDDQAEADAVAETEPVEMQTDVFRAELMVRHSTAAPRATA